MTGQTVEVPRLSPEELTDLARGVVTNRIYVAWDYASMEYSFGMYLKLVVGGLSAQGDDISWAENIGLCYEEMDKAGPMAMNGYPVFFSAKFVHKDDHHPLQRECIRLAVALGAASQEDLDKFDEELAEFNRLKAEAAAKEEGGGSDGSAG